MASADIPFPVSHFKARTGFLRLRWAHLTHVAAIGGLLETSRRKSALCGGRARIYIAGSRAARVRARRISRRVGLLLDRRSASHGVHSSIFLDIFHPRSCPLVVTFPTTAWPTATVDVDVLHSAVLLPFAAILLQCFHLSSESSQKPVRVSQTIVDCGYGMSKEVPSRIFEDHSHNKTGERHGTGSLSKAGPEASSHDSRAQLGPTWKERNRYFDTMALLRRNRDD